MATDWFAEHAPAAPAAPPPVAAPASGDWFADHAPEAPTFHSQNDFDAQGNPIVHSSKTTGDYLVESIPGIGPILGTLSDHPHQYLLDKVEQWAKAGPHAVVEGLRDLTAGNYAKGANQVLTGGFVTAAPMLAPELVLAAGAAPLATAVALIKGAIAAGVSGAALEKIGRDNGLTDDQIALLKTTGEIGGGWAGAKAPTPELPAGARGVVGAGLRATGVVLDNPVTEFIAPGFVGRIGRGASALGEVLQAPRAAQAATSAVAAEAAPAVTESTDDYVARIMAQTHAEEAAIDAQARAAITPHPPPPAAPVAPPPAPVQRPPSPPPPPAPVEPPAPVAAVASAPPTPAPAPPVRPTPRPLSTDPVEMAQQLQTAGYSERLAQQIVRQLQAKEPWRFTAAPAAAPVVPVPPVVAPSPVVVAPVTPTPAPIIAAAPVGAAVSGPPPRVMSPQMALNEVGLAARRAGIPMTLEQSTAAAEYVQEGLTPRAALQRWQDAGQPSATVVATPRPPAPPSGPRNSVMSPQMAQNEMALAARRAGVPMTFEQVQEAAALVQQGLTPKAALQRWVDAAVQRSAVAPAPAAVVAAPPATASAVDPAAELAARLGTPSDAQRDAALDARYRTGKTKTPSAPTAARMQAEADARIAAERATTPAPTVAPAPAPPPTKPTRVRTQKAPAAVVAASAATTDTPVEAAKTVTNQIERVIDTQGLKSGAAVQARVMEALTKEIQAAREAAGFGDITTRRTGTTGGVVSVDGEPVATWDKGGAVRWMGGGGVGMHGRSLGPPPEVLPGVPGDTPIGRYPINARNMSPSEVERAAKNAVAATISRTRGAGQMRVQIPGDGTFTIERNPHAINELMRRLQSAGVSIWKDLL